MKKRTTSTPVLKNGIYYVDTSMIAIGVTVVELILKKKKKVIKTIPVKEIYVAVKADPNESSGNITASIPTDANGHADLGVDLNFVGPEPNDSTKYKGYLYVYSGEDSPLAVNLTFPIMSAEHREYVVEIDSQNLRQKKRWAKN